MSTMLELLPAGTEQLSSEEEGEIIELDDDDDDDGNVDDTTSSNIHNNKTNQNGRYTCVDFEDISSDEELSLRQRIEELIARNQELEKIASISKSASADVSVAPAEEDYGRFHPPKDSSNVRAFQ